MAKAIRQSKTRAEGSGSILAIIGAGLLILLGVMFQLGEFGYSHLSPSNFWLAAMVAEGFWNILAMHLNVPVVGELLRYWPLVFVTFGLGLLLVMKRDSGMRLSKVSVDSRGSDYGK